MANDGDPDMASAGGPRRERGTHLRGLQPPGPIDLTRDREENFMKFKQKWKRYTLLSHLEHESDEYQANLLLYSAGDECARLVDTAAPTLLTENTVLN